MQTANASRRAVDPGAARALPPGRRNWPLLLGLGALLVLTVVLSLALGARPLAPGAVLQALFSFGTVAADDPAVHAIVHDLRLPRTLAGIMAGLGLGVAGVLMQALSRNPLADPGLLGLNAGASAGMVLALWGLGLSGALASIWFAMLGTALTLACVFALGSIGRTAGLPLRLVLAGAALNAFLFAVVRAVLLLNQEALEVYRFWVVGSLTQADAGALALLAPFFLAGLALAALTAGALNLLALGDESARALGLRPGLARLGAALAVVLLCAASVAVAGPVGFLGLVVPHLARLAVGVDNRRCLLAAALIGPALMLGADVAGRLVLHPGELEVGIMAALLGGPVFIHLVRRMRIYRS